jgi:D-3-phosphoglycerate dehydrogenase
MARRNKKISKGESGLNTAKSNGRVFWSMGDTSWKFMDGQAQAVLEKAGIEMIRHVGELDEQAFLEKIHQLKDQRPVQAFLIGGDRVTEKVLKAAKEHLALEMVVRLGAGYDLVDVEGCKRHGVSLANSPGMDRPVAEHTMGLIYSLLKKMPHSMLETRNRQWSPKPRGDLYRKKLGLMGYGRIGIAFSGMIAGDVDLRIYDPKWGPLQDNAFDEIRKHVEVKKEHRRERFRIQKRDESKAYTGNTERVTNENEIKHWADIIVLTMPLNDFTRKMVNRTWIAECSKGVMLINPSRAGLAEEEDVKQALVSGQLGGYAVDGAATEPNLETCPLLDPAVPHCYMTPHEAAFTPIAANEIAMLACDNSVSALNGRHDHVYEYIVGPFDAG